MVHGGPSSLKVVKKLLDAGDIRYYFNYRSMKCTLNSKINGTPKGVYLPISKIDSILAVANSLAHNNLWYIIMYK